VIAEYAATYGGLPTSGRSWHEVLALATRTGRFGIRRRLEIAEGRILGEPSDSGIVAQLRLKYHRLAYPGSTDGA